MLEEVVKALADLGDGCVCNKVYILDDVGKTFHCPEHGVLIISQIETTGFNDLAASHVVTLYRLGNA